MRGALLLLALVSAGACVRGRGAEEPVSRETWSTRDWPSALAAAQQAALDGRFDTADRELELFAERNPGTAQSREAAYWRAIFLLDPENEGGKTVAAITQLERYLADDLEPVARRSEARMLLRVATQLDSLRRLTGEVRVASARSADSVATAREREASELQKQNQQLKEQLDKTTAELERIKKRLAERP